MIDVDFASIELLVSLLQSRRHYDWQELHQPSRGKLRGILDCSSSMQRGNRDPMVHGFDHNVSRNCGLRRRRIGHLWIYGI